MSTQSLSPTSTLERSVAYRRSLSIPVVAFLSALIPAVGLMYALLTSYAALTERSYSTMNGDTGELVATHSVGQSFIARYNGLSAVSLWLGTYGRPAQADLLLHLRRAPDGPDVTTVGIPASQIRGENPWQIFSFPPIENSEGQQFFVSMESPEARPGKALTLFWWESKGRGDPYPLGAAFVDGTQKSADLAFTLHYSPPILEAWAQTARAFSINAAPLFVIMLGALLLAALFWTVWRIRKDRETSSLAKTLGQGWVLPIVLSVGVAHGLLYALLIPPWQGPDEFSHFSYAALLDRYDLDDRVVQQLEWQGKDRDAALIDSLAESMNRHNFSRYQGGSAEPGAPVIPDTKSVYAELRQPATYYWLCAVAMRAARQIGVSANPYTDADTALRVMRLISVILSLGVVALAWVAGRLLSAQQGLRSWLPLLLPLTVALLPMRAFVDGIANNDVMAELAVSALVVALIALLRWPRGWRGPLLAALVMLIAVVSSATKSSALTAVVPLAGLGLVAWLGMMLRRTEDEGRRTNGESLLPGHVRAVAVGGGLCCALVVVTILALPLLFREQESATGWRLGNRPIEKAPVSLQTDAHSGKYALSLVNGIFASQRVELAVPHPELRLSLTGYARLYTGNGAKSGKAIISMVTPDKTSAQQELELGTSTGWVPFNATLKVQENAEQATVKLAAQGGTVEFDDFSLASDGVSPVGVLLNPSFERQEVALAKPIARFLPDEAQWIAQVMANPQPFDKGKLWGHYADEQFHSFWGLFGWIAVPLPDTWFLFWFMVSILALLGILWKTISAMEAWQWRDWLRLVFLAGIALAIVLGFARHTMLLSVFGIQAYPQGRYLFVLSIPIAWLLLSGLSVWANKISELRARASRPSTGKLQAPQVSAWLPAWAWMNLVIWFAAYALGALVVPYFYG